MTILGKSILPILVFLGVSFLATAQKLNAIHYTTKNGFPSMWSGSALLDDRGALWIRTDKGIAINYGYGFELLPTDPEVTGTFVTHIVKGTDGKLWLKSIDNLISYYQDGEFYAYPHQQRFLDSLKNTDIFSFDVDSNENLWFGFYDHPDSILFASLTLSGEWRKDPVFNSGTYGCQLKHIGQGRYIYGQLMNLKNNNPHIKPTLGLAIPDQGVFLPELHLGRVVESKNQAVLLLDNHFLVAIEDKILIKNLISKELTVHDFPGMYIGGIYRGGPSNILVSFKSNSGVRSLDLMTSESGKDSLVLKEQFLEDQVVTSLFFGPESGIWISTRDDGVYYAPSLQSVLFTDENGLPNSKVSSVFYHNHKLYLGHPDGWVSKFNPRSNQSFESERNSKHFQGEIGRFSNSKGDHVIASGQYGVGLYDDIETFNYLRAFIEFDSVMWTQAYSINKETYKLKLMHFFQGLNISSFAHAQNNDVLVGTFSGLYLLEIDQGDTVLKSLAHVDPVFGKGIKEVSRINSSLWAIVPSGFGVYLWDGEKVFDLFDKVQGIGNSSSGVFVSSDSTLWVSSEKGFYHLNVTQPVEPQLIADWTEEDGLPGQGWNDFWVDEDYLWIASSFGLGRVEYSAKEKLAQKLPFHIYSAEVNAEKLPNRSELGYQFGVLRIAFGAISFKNYKNVLYKYRIKGINDSWETTDIRFLQLANLPPGDYEVQVYAFIQDGDLESEIKSFQFTVLPPFWMTWWFYLLVVMALALLIYGLFNWRLRRIKKQLAVKELIRDQHYRILRMKMNPHFIFNVLNSIQHMMTKNDAASSSEYLSGFAKLMRFNFNNTSRHRIAFEEEWESLKLYANLEEMRLIKGVEVSFYLDPQLDQKRVQIPPLLIQPILENAIIHGRSQNGSTLQVSVRAENDDQGVRITVEDNGIGIYKNLGLAESNFEALQEHLRNSSKSDHGFSITLDRIRLHNEELGCHSEIEVVPQSPKDHSGTVVSFILGV
ncbi:histidine kinase [bacterium SCSIO 12741]|nr:histidine kinase [bacterium SCSIO 12741]